MLEFVRKYSSGTFAWVILMVVAASFIFSGVSSVFLKDTNSIAWVNGEKISKQEFEHEYSTVMQQMHNSQIDNPEFLRKRLLDTMVERIVMLQAAKSLGLIVTEQDVVAAINSYPYFKDENAVFSKELYKQALSRIGLTDKSFREKIRADLLVNEMISFFNNSGIGTQFDVDTAINLISQTRDINYILFKAQDFQNQVELTDEDISAYYVANKGKFVTPAKVSINYIILSLDELMEKVEVNDSILEEYYQENLDNYNSEAEIKVAHILLTGNQAEMKEKVAMVQEKLAAGEDFAKVAMEYSEDPGSNKQGGELGGWFSKGRMVPQFEKVVFAMQNGEVSQPFLTTFGTHIAKLLDSKAKRQQSFDEAKDKVELDFRREKAVELYAETADELEALTMEHPDTLEVAASKLGLTIMDTELFNNDFHEGILGNRKVLEESFSENVVNDKNNSEVIDLNEENKLVLRLKEYVGEHQQTLAESSAKITEILLHERSSKLAEEKAEALKTKVEQEGTGAVTAWKSSEEITRMGNDGLEAELVNRIFALPKNFEKPNYLVYRLATGDFMLLYLTKVSSKNVLAEEEKEAFDVGFIAKKLGKTNLGLFMQQKLKEADIVYADS